MEEAWSVPDVYLLTEGPDGTVAVPHLTLTFLPAGLTLQKADGETVWERWWPDLEEVSPVERSVLPDGRDGVAMLVVERGGRQHRFVLAAADPGHTESAIRGRAEAHGLRTRTGRSPVSKVLTVGIVVAAMATLTALLLSAAHVFQF
jgi:hypothetical protein